MYQLTNGNISSSCQLVNSRLACCSISGNSIFVYNYISGIFSLYQTINVPGTCSAISIFPQTGRHILATGFSGTANGLSDSGTVSIYIDSGSGYSLQQTINGAYNNTVCKLFIAVET